MSKHSKWAKIKRKKGAADVKKGATFTKLTNNVTIAVKEGGGGDPAMNFKLRLAIDAARAQNVPKENIERAIARGLGASGGAELEQLLYEGYGPAHVAVMMEVTTDNRNRSASELKHLFSDFGGSLASQGAVAWMFEKKGVIRIPLTPTLSSQRRGNSEEVELQLIDAGAQDIQREEDIMTILSSPNDLQKVKEIAENLGLTVDEASLEWIAKESMAVTQPQAQERIAEFLGQLEDRDDVTGVYTNASLTLLV